MLTTVCAIISAVYMLIMLAETAISLARAKRRHRCELILKFKKGKFAAMYLAGLPLYFAAYIGDGFFLGSLNAVNATLRLAVLSFDFSSLLPLMAEDIFFRIAVVMCVVFTYINTLLLTFSISFRAVTNRVRLLRIKRARRNVLVLVGYNEKNRTVLESMKREENKLFPTRDKIDVLIASDSVTDAIKDDAYVSYAAYVKTDLSIDLGELLPRWCGGFDQRHCRVMINTGDTERDLTLAYSAARFADELGESIITLASDEARSTGFDAHVFTDGEQDRLFTEAIRISHGALHTANESRIISEDFILGHPVTEILSEAIDTELAVLKEDTELRVFLLGEDEVIDPLSSLIIQNAQLLELTSEGGKRALKPADVKYYRIGGNGSSPLSQYESFLCEGKAGSAEYLELPPLPAKISHIGISAADRNFRTRLGELLADKSGGYNMLVIAGRTDLDTMMLTTAAQATVSEFAATGNTTVYVRLHSAALCRELEGAASECRTVSFGTDESVYSYSRTVSEGIEELAIGRHLTYSLESRKPAESFEEAVKRALNKWLFEWDPVQRDSNVYATLSIPSRLNLLGFALSAGEGEDASEEFLRAYTKGNPIAYTELGGRRIADYSDLGYRAPFTPRTNIAITEHMRWCAYYMQNGFVPASVDEYRSQSKKELTRSRRHINLTTFEGLVDYENMLMSERGYSLSDADVIKYDYQLMDDAVRILKKNGYTVIKRK